MAETPERLTVSIASIGTGATITGSSSVYLDPNRSYGCNANCSKDDVNLYSKSAHEIFGDLFYSTVNNYIEAGSVSGKKFIGWYSIPADVDTTRYDESNLYYYGGLYTLLVSTDKKLLMPSVSAINAIWKRTSGINPGSSFFCSFAAKYRTAYSFTVTYAPGENGTGAQQTATKTEGAALTLAGATFTRIGYTQTGWATSDGGAKVYDLAGSYTANAAVTLYPVWTPNTYTVTLVDEYHDSQTVEVTYGAGYGVLPSPTVAGYGFAGWFTSDDGGTRITSETVVSTAADHILYAHWNVSTYTVVYHGNGGIGTMSDSVFSYEQTDALVPACSFEKTGYTCVGWSLTAGGAAAYRSGVTHLRSIVDDLGGPSGPINLYAVWETAEYTVSFNSESYLGDPIPPITVRYGGTYGELQSVLMDGDPNYIFDGWFYGETEIKSGDRVRIASDIELSAQFHPKRVTILLDATSGGRWFPDSEGTKSVVWVYEGSKPSITPPSMTDYEFEQYVIGSSTVYWEDGSVGQIDDWNAIEDGSTVTATAQWRREQFTITLKSDSDTLFTTVSCGFHEIVGNVEPPAKTGYTFTGWSPRIPRFMPKANMTCTAQWSANSYNVAFALVGGVFASDATVPSSGTFDGESAMAVPAPTRSGCTFAGWKVTSGLDATTAKYGKSANVVTLAITSESTLCANVAEGETASGTVYFKNLSAEDGALVVLTAQWTVPQYTIEFNPGLTSGNIQFQYDPVSGDPVSPVATTVTKKYGEPYPLSVGNAPSYSTIRDDIIIVGWSSTNATGTTQPNISTCEYPTGTEYVDEASQTLYPVTRVKSGAVYDEIGGHYKNLIIPVTCSCGGITAVGMARAGMGYARGIGTFCESVATSTVIGWKYDDGFNVTTIPTSQGRDSALNIDGRATSLVISPVFDVNSSHTPVNVVVYEYGALHPDSDVDDVGSYYPHLMGEEDIGSYSYGSSTIKSAIYTRDGFVQVGWTDYYVLGGVVVSSPYSIETVNNEKKIKYNGNVVGSYFDFGDTYSGSTIVLYPVWSRRQYDLTIDTDGGSFPADAKALCLYDADKTLSGVDGVYPLEDIYNGDVVWIPRPHRTGYRFVGWVFKEGVEYVFGEHPRSVSYLARFTVPLEDFSDVTEDSLSSSAGEIIESKLVSVPDVGSEYAGYLKDGTTPYRQGEWIAIKNIINVGREPNASVTMKAVWRKNTKYRVRFNKVDGESGNVTFTTKEHGLGEEWIIPNVGGDTEEKSGTEGDQDVTTELGWSFPGFRFDEWAHDFGESTDGEKIALGADTVIGEDEIIDFFAEWEPIQSHVTFRADDWQTETLEASGNVVDGLIGVAPASASRTMSDSPGKVDHGFILEPTETFTPKRTFGQKVFALVTDYVSQMSVLLRDDLLWTEKVTKDRSYLLSYASLIPVTAGYAYGNDRTMGAVKMNGKGVAIGDTYVTDDVIYADEATFRAEPLGGYRFVGWYTSETELSDETLYSRAAETVVFIDDTNGISLYAKFAPDPNGIYRWEGSKQNKLMEWKSKVYVGSKPFNPSALRVDATGYPPLEVTVGMFSSPDADATATARLTNIVSQDSRRLPRLRPERYMQIGVKHDAEVDAIFVGTSMGGLAV